MASRRFPESALFGPVKRWLEGHGYTVWAEVPHFNSPMDVVGRNGDHLIAVELKTSLTAGVLGQAALAQLCCDEAFAAVATCPRDVDRARRLGVGVLSVRDGAVTVVSEPINYNGPCGPHRTRILDYTAYPPDDVVGGLPNRKGIGPAQNCARKVARYRAKHPQASWQDVYEQVRNHYSNARSMAAALRRVRVRRQDSSRKAR